MSHHPHHKLAKTLTTTPLSDDQLNQQINDKLSQLWTGMKNKRKQFLRNLTPSYSRRSQLTISQMNQTQGNTVNNISSNNNENQRIKIKEKLVSEQQDKQLNQSEIEKLKNTISQLTNDKKILIKEIQSLNNRSLNNDHIDCSQQPYQEQQHSQIQHHYHTVDGKTANFCTKNKNQKPSQIFNTKKSNPKLTQQSLTKSNKQNHQLHNNTTKASYNYLKEQTLPLEDLSKQRLIELLKSTSEYRQFAYYYDSHQLSYLKRLQQQHKKNCPNNYSEMEKKYWAPTQIVENIKHHNSKQKWGLNESQVEEIVSEMKGYFEVNQEIKLKQIRGYYQKKIEKLKREKQNSVPYDVVRLTNAKEREFSKKRTKSIRQ